MTLRITTGSGSVISLMVLWLEKMVLKNFVIAVTILARITFYLMGNRLNTFMYSLK